MWKTKEQKALNRLSNRDLIKSKGNKLYVPHAKTTITVYAGRKNTVITSCLPTVNYDNGALRLMLQGCLIHWQPHLDFSWLSKKSFHVLYVSKYPFYVMDIDDVSPEKVREALKGSYIMKKFNPLITASRNGGTHIVFRFDLSHIWQDRYVKNEAEGLEK